VKVKRVDNVIWACREIGKYPNGHVSCDGNFIRIAAEPGDGHSYILRLDRKLARLLARRINQCLDQT
jgi:hypothetical protein